VLRSWVGYTGGGLGANDPTYESVCARNNTFTEALRLEFDPAVLSFEGLMQLYVKEPRVLRAVCRDGLSPLFARPQTRVAVWAQDEAQMAVARQAIADAGKTDAVPVLPPAAWFLAEEYHQKFIEDDKAFPDWSEPVDEIVDDASVWDSSGDSLRGPGTTWGL